MDSARGTIAGSVAALWRYPVKSMLGEELSAADVTDRGVVGDRAYALMDPASGKVVSAKDPRRWGEMFTFRAYYAEATDKPSALPPAWIVAADGAKIATNQPDANEALSQRIGRPVTVSAAAPEAPILEGYWPDHDWLESPDRAFDVAMPPGTFFDSAVVHLVTTATLEKLSALTPQSRFETCRFRPNFVIDVSKAGAQGFVENDWVGRTLVLGDEVRLHVSAGCARCVMTTLPQSDLPKDPHVLRTIVQNNYGNVGVLASVVRGGRVERGNKVEIH
jgi:uncharacterized protein